MTHKVGILECDLQEARGHMRSTHAEISNVCEMGGGSLMAMSSYELLERKLVIMSQTYRPHARRHL